MNKSENLAALIDKAIAGDRDFLETVILSVRDLIFNLCLRMLGTFYCAEDATQDIILKLITHLSSFKQESSFSTWVFIATNHLITYKKHNMFAQYPLPFEFYGDDIENALVRDIPNVEKSILAEELKMSCTNVTLQCLNTDSRLIFVLGTMLKADSRIAGGILGITPEAYRQRLSRIRRKMADFLSAYCGEYGSGKCRCGDRLNYTAASESSMKKALDFKNTMEDIDGLSAYFFFSKLYESPEHIKQFLAEFLESNSLSTVKKLRRKTHEYDFRLSFRTCGEQ